MSNPNTMNEQAIRRESMARPANEGKWRRRALSAAKSVANAAGSAGHFVAETRAGKLAAAAVLIGTLSQTPAGKDITQKVVTGTEDAAGTALNVTGDVLRPVADWLTGPHFENNPFAIETAKVIHKEAPLRNGEHFAHDMTVVPTNPTDTLVFVYPIPHNTSDGKLVLPIGSIPAGTEFNKMLITPGDFYYTGVNDPSKPENDPSVAGHLDSITYGAVDCNVVASVLIDSSGSTIPNLTDKYPACFIPSSNLQKTSR